MPIVQAHIAMFVEAQPEEGERRKRQETERTVVLDVIIIIKL